MRNYTCPANTSNPAYNSADCEESMAGFYIIAAITCIVIAASWIYKRHCKKPQALQEQPVIECASTRGSTRGSTVETRQTPVTSYIPLPSAPPAEDDPSDPR